MLKSSIQSVIHFYNFIWAVLFCPKLKPLVGKFYGEVGYKPDDYEQWIYEPVQYNPLSYETSDGYIIIPGKMTTDGASIPKWLGWFGYDTLRSVYFLKPALIHDWLFESHKKQEPVVIGLKPNGDLLYNKEMTFTKANRIFAESIRKDMIDKNMPVEEDIIKIFFQAVQKFGREVWNNIENKGEQK